MMTPDDSSAPDDFLRKFIAEIPFVIPNRPEIGMAGDHSNVKLVLVDMI